MRLINSRFARENKFFWDERANIRIANNATYSKSSKKFSGTLGDADLNTLITKLQKIGYYQELFKYTYGSRL
jgi:cytochrome c peroxidase